MPKRAAKQPVAPDAISGSVYDYPLYYDLIFAADWREEFEFLEGCFQEHARRSVKSVFEPACGTGRLLVKFAERGYQVAGNDLNAKAVEFCNARLVRLGFPASATVGDMAAFKLKKQVDSAFNTINSFRHLPDEKTAVAHLQCMAAAVAKGGLYVLGLHLTPPVNRVCDEETWRGGRGSLQVKSRMWSISVDHRKRRELVGMTYDVTSPRRRLHLEDQFALRTYTPAQMKKLFAAVPQWEVAGTYDFGYDLDEQIPVDDKSEDVVYVLRKR